MRQFTILIFLIPFLGVQCEEESPLLNMAASFLQNMGENGGNNNGLAAIGSLFGTLMQGDNAKHLGSLFGQNGGDAGDMISGIGSLLGGGQEGRGLDPSLIGSVISMFAQNMAPVDTKGKQMNRRKRNIDPDADVEVEEEEGFDINNVLGVASNFLQNEQASKIVPFLLNTVSALAEGTDKVAHNHKEHAHFLPPFVEQMHLYWDSFMQSDLGKMLWYKTGLDKITKSFTSPDGKISFALMMKNLDNRAFRRHWIKGAALYLAETAIHMSKPEIYQKYLVTGQHFINGFLASQGFPKKTHFNFNKPESSLSALINHLLKKYFEMDTNVSGYVKPAVEYIKKILDMARVTSEHLKTKEEYNALADYITDTLNLELIEPVLRVYRAYKHSVNKPECQKHLMCLVNRHHDADQKAGLPSLKAGLTKLSSIVASATLSYYNGGGFWDLYNAVADDVNCQAKYPADCSSFYEHEMRVTTETYHSEL